MNDKSKIKEFMHIFQKERVLKFVSILEKSYYPKDFFVDYEKFNEGLLTTFQDDNINNAFKSFDLCLEQITNALRKITVGVPEGEDKNLVLIFLQGENIELWEAVERLKKEYVNFTDIASRKLENKNNQKGRGKTSVFEIDVRDREIWINDYLISKPHAVGKNMSFFEYLISNPNTEILRKKLPKILGEDTANKKFSKILNDIGFKGEILKAFFPKRGKGSLFFTPKINSKDLEKRGIKINIFLKELELAHERNSSK